MYISTIDEIDEETTNFIIDQIEKEKVMLEDRFRFIVFRKENGKYIINTFFVEKECSKEEFYEELRKVLGKVVKE